MTDKNLTVAEIIENHKQNIETLEAENADLSKKLEQSKETVRYYSDLSIKHNADFERIHRILDHLHPAPPRAEEKTEDNQWPDKYDLVTRLSIWLGNK